MDGYNYKWLSFLLLWLFVCESVHSQNSFRQIWNQIWLEKGSISNWETLEQQARLQTIDNDGQYFSTARDILAEQRIGLTQKSESEIHAAINPSDSNQLIVSCMRYNPSSVWSFSLYSSQNFGQSWFESSFSGQHPGNEMIAGGGDPLLAFETTGKAHFVWLLITVNPQNLSGKIGLYHAESLNGGISWTSHSDPIDFGNLQFGQGGDLLSADRLVDKPWIAVDHTDGFERDNIYVVYFAYQTSPDSLGSIQCIRKTRNQSTFSSSPVTVNSQHYAALQFASVDVDGEGGVHVCFWASLDGQNAALYHAKSLNGGISFEPETMISPLAFPVADYSNGFPPSDLPGIDRLYPAPTIVADQSKGPFANRLYAAWTAKGIEQNSTNGYDIYFSWSADQGIQWSPAQVLNDDLNPDHHQYYPSLSVNSAGMLIAGWYDRRGQPDNLQTDYYLSYSLNGGQSFENQSPISSQASDFSKVGLNNSGFGIGEYTQIVSTQGYAIPFWTDGRANTGQINVYAACLALNGTVASLARWQSLTDHITVESFNILPLSNDLRINWNLKKNAPVHFEIVDILGRKIWEETHANLSAGAYEHNWKLNISTSGQYFFKIESLDKQWVRIFDVN